MDIILEKKTVYKAINSYLVKIMNGMALGLFSSLIIGVILKQVGTVFNLKIFIQFGQIAQYSMGGAIGAGVSYVAGASPLGIFSAMICGTIGSGTISFNEGIAVLKVGEPVGAFIAAIIGAEASKLIENKTPVNIVAIPIVTIVSGGLVGITLAPFIADTMKTLGTLINMGTHLHPFFMGIVVSLLMGIFLTLPISSAAIAISLGLSGIAAGAATVGCCAHMVGFAVAGYKDNGIGGIFSQGIGTSMIQMPNIIKKPIIALPAIVTSIILGPFSTTIFKIENNSIGAGMGTSGLIGQLMAIETMGKDKIVTIIFATIILPGILSYIISHYMRKKDILTAGDMKI